MMFFITDPFVVEFDFNTCFSLKLNCDVIRLGPKFIDASELCVIIIPAVDIFEIQILPAVLL